MSRIDKQAIFWSLSAWVVTVILMWLLLGKAGIAIGCVTGALIAPIVAWEVLRQ